MANILRVSYDSKEAWPIKTVTVYEDRAQITRILDYKAIEHGEVELKLENLPLSIVAETVRAEVETGNVGIFEVACNTVTSEVKEIQVSDREKEIEEKIKQLHLEDARINEKLEWMGSYGNLLVPSVLDNKDKGKKMFEDIISDGNLQNFSKSLEFYDEEVGQRQERRIEISKEISELEEESAKLRQKAFEEQDSSRKSGNEATVLIHVPESVAKEGSIVTIKLFYVVRSNSCSWNAIYDVRVLKKDNDVSINYYAKITNSTGEDWNDVQVFLSTAKPSRAGNLPLLPRAIAKIIKPQDIIMEQQEQSKKFAIGGRMRRKKRNNRNDRRDMIGEEVEAMADLDMMAMSVRLDNHSDAEDEDDMEDQLIMQEIEAAVTQEETETETKGGSALFKLARLCSIESDNKPHRQTIGSLKLTPRFSYVVSPKVSSNCFLKCSARNTSSFVLVPGDMSVFFNESFVTITKMNLVNQNENFSFFLGVEESVKVDYQPEISKDEVLKGGLLTSKQKTQMCSRTIKIINTRNEEIDCVFFEQIPYPRNEKIKVEVLSPDIKAKGGPEVFKQTNLSHLEGKTKIKANATWEIKFDYKVTWPFEEEIVYAESLENQQR